jgi:hypothetical protein
LPIRYGDDAILLAPLLHNLAECLAAKSMPFIKHIQVCQLSLEPTERVAASNGFVELLPGIILLDSIDESDMPLRSLTSNRLGNAR